MPTQLGAALVLTEPEIRELLTPAACIAAVERAFTSYAIGAAELPGVIHLDIPDARGEIHIKAGYLHTAPWYAVKFASGFPGNSVAGLPVNGGIVVVFDARTGALRDSPRQRLHHRPPHRSRGRSRGKVSRS